MLRNFVLITAGLGATAVNFHKKEHMMTVPAGDQPTLTAEQQQALVDQAAPKTGAKPAAKKGCSEAEEPAKSSVAAVADGTEKTEKGNTKTDDKGCSPAKPDDKAGGNAENAENAEAKATPKGAAAVHVAQQAQVAQQAHDIKTMMTKNGKYIGIGGLSTVLIVVIVYIIAYMSAKSAAGAVLGPKEKADAMNDSWWKTLMPCMGQYTPANFQQTGTVHTSKLPANVWDSATE